MKITKRQLRKLILKEFKGVDDPNKLKFSNSHFDDMLKQVTGPPIPPDIIPPNRRGGGDNCRPGSPRYEAIYKMVRNGIEPWMQQKFPSGNFYLEYEKHLISLGIPMFGKNAMKRIIVVWEAIVDYLCQFGGNTHDLFNDPRRAFTRR